MRVMQCGIKSIAEMFLKDSEECIHYVYSTIFLEMYCMACAVAIFGSVCREVFINGYMLNSCG